MVKTIFKYNLDTTTIQVIQMPINAKILTVQTQYNEPKLWVLVNPMAENFEERIIEIYGTGQPIEYPSGFENRKYIGTYQLNEGKYVFHVFEKMCN